jgi:hypothetical protein
MHARARAHTLIYGHVCYPVCSRGLTDTSDEVHCPFIATKLSLYSEIF